MFKDIFRLLRVRQWLKNILLFFPIFFSGHFIEIEKLEKVFISFISFSLLASACYIINDIKDIKSDKQHPKKCQRPIASGKVSKNTGFMIFIFLFGLSFSISTATDTELSLINLLYFANVMLYTYLLKKIPYVDVIFISIGFILRLYAGAVHIKINLSIWLIVMTFLVAMMLGLGKRYEDIIKCPDTRHFIFNYDKSVTKILLFSSGFSAIIIFGFYLFFHNYFSIPLLMVSSILIVNYIHSALVKLKGEPTDFFTSNIFNILMLLLWGAIFYFRIYE